MPVTSGCVASGRLAAHRHKSPLALGTWSRRRLVSILRVDPPGGAGMRQTSVSMIGASLVVLLGLTAGSAQQPTVDGTWEGTWATGGSRGGLVLRLTQSGERVWGTYDVDGGPAGTLRGLLVKGTLKDDDLTLAGHGRTLFEGRVRGETIVGSYRATKTFKEFYVRRR